MKTSRFLTALFVFLVLTSLAAGYPPIVRYVNDFAGVLTPSQESTLNSIAQQIEQSTTVQIAIVTVESTGGEDRVLYANHLGDESGVGKAATDNGLVLLWSMANEKGGAIAVGSGIESILNDAKVGRIGRNSRPYFDSQDYYGGFLSMLDDIRKELGIGAGAAQSAASTSMSSSDVLMWIMILGILILVVIALSRRQRREGYWRPGPVVITGPRRHWRHSSGFRAGSFVGRSFGGFRGGGFGGGGFSGGGAKF